MGMSVCHRREAMQKVFGLGHYLFTYSLVLYIGVLLTESLWETSVSSILNPNYLLLIVLGSGVISILRRGTEKTATLEPLRVRHIVLVAATGIAVAGLVWYGTQDYGAISYFTSGAVGTVAAATAMLLFAEVR